MAFVKLRRWYRTVRNWPANRVIAGASVIIALCSMAIALSSFVLSIREARMSREHDRLLVQPHFLISFNYNEDGVSWVAFNDGLGPARIRGLMLLVDDVSQNWTEPFPNAIENALKIHPKKVSFVNPMVGTTISSGNDMILMSVPAGPDADAIKADVERVSFEVCYCSIYNECWLFDSTNLDSERDDSCSDFKDEPLSLWWNG
jgi:hypothetical protein